MLKDDQAAELLRKCENIAGKCLPSVRGFLTKPQSRASAVWELLVFEIFSAIGKVEYEPRAKSCPDILLRGDNLGSIWIETTFLYPRFWKNDRKAWQIRLWIGEVLKKNGINAYQVSYHFYGDENNKAGPVRKLPELCDKGLIVNSRELSDFTYKIRERPNSEHSTQISDYTFFLKYNPNAKGPYTSITGVIEESPESIEEHALYRKLRKKANQHKKLDAPYIICVGSDQSPILSSHQPSFGITERDVVASIFKKFSNVSGICVVSIEWESQLMSRSQNIAKRRWYMSNVCEHPLNKKSREKFKILKFNKWKYTFSLEKWDQENHDHFKRVGGNLVSATTSKNGKRIEVPAKLIIESLAGKTNLIKEYSLNKNDDTNKWLTGNWVIKSCTFKEGDIEKGKDDIVVLGLVQGPESVYWPQQKK